MEEGKTNKLYMTFILDVPDNTEKSDFNKLILRLQKLRDSIENVEHDEIFRKCNNHNVTEINKLKQENEQLKSELGYTRKLNYKGNHIPRID